MMTVSLPRKVSKLFLLSFSFGFQGLQVRVFFVESQIVIPSRISFKKQKRLHSLMKSRK